MKVSELIREILVLSDIYSEDELKNFKKSELEKIFDDLNNEYFGDDNVDVEESDSDDESSDDEIVIDITTLSKADQRLYSRTGQISKSTLDKLR